MSKNPLILICLTLLLCLSPAMAQSAGEKLFNQICFACHTIGEGRRVGPDLDNVQLKHSEQWLIDFIRSSSKVIESGDAAAVARFEEYNKLTMPDNPYSDAEIRSILQYIAKKSTPSEREPQQEKTISEGPSAEQATYENFLSGKKIFTGITRFTNGGASCISCHHVMNDSVFAGGSLAMDLTAAYSRLSEAGLKAILKNPPFPAMKQAYLEKSLSPDEIYDLTAFLYQMNQNQDKQAGKNHILRFIFAGIGGAALLLLFFWAVWLPVKKKSVNQKIYDRQIKAS